MAPGRFLVDNVLTREIGVLMTVGVILLGTVAIIPVGLGAIGSDIIPVGLEAIAVAILLVGLGKLVAEVDGVFAESIFESDFRMYSANLASSGETCEDWKGSQLVSMFLGSSILRSLTSQSTTLLAASEVIPIPSKAFNQIGRVFFVGFGVAGCDGLSRGEATWEDWGR